ncbi:hypothetical protein, partial [Klebsiella pneumoniae]|uniref:hypothetical protein n=1 Tax=Klebsiella pneumoniae TaxID=573 RepID=UPI003B983E83
TKVAYAQVSAAPQSSDFLFSSIRRQTAFGCRSRGFGDVSKGQPPFPYIPESFSQCLFVIHPFPQLRINFINIFITLH